MRPVLRDAFFYFLLWFVFAEESKYIFFSQKHGGKDFFMKRYIMMAVSIALMISSLLYLPENTTPVIVAGAGNGENCEVTTVDELDSLLNFFNQHQASNIASSNTFTDVKLTAVNPTGDIPQNVKNHTSATMYNDTYLEASFAERRITLYDYEFGNHSYEVLSERDVRFNRTLTIYMTENDTYYVSKGTLRENYIDLRENENSTLNVMDFDVQIYVSYNRCLMKFNKFKIQEDGENIADASAVIGKWIEFPEEAAIKMINFIDQANRSVLSEIQKCLDDGFKGFEKNGGKYTLKTKLIKENDTELVADLSDAEYPFLSLKTDSQEYPNIVNMTDKITFSNIDNTIINVDFEEVEVMDMAALEDLMGGL